VWHFAVEVEKKSLGLLPRNVLMRLGGDPSDLIEIAHRGTNSTASTAPGLTPSSPNSFPYLARPALCPQRYRNTDDNCTNNLVEEIVSR
jgi:hypothetical protein